MDLLTVLAHEFGHVLGLPDVGGQTQDGASALANQDRDDSARAREFEFREIAWKKQRADLVQQGRDPDRFAAESLARALVPASGPMPVVNPSKPTVQPRTARVWQFDLCRHDAVAA